MPEMGHSPFARFTRIKHPVAREEELLVEHLADETVVYDTRTKEAHCLSALAAVVFDHCDGRTTVEQLATLATERLGGPVDPPRVMDALSQLQESDLLAVPPRDGLSRRQMIHKSAAAGGALVGASLITTIMAPTAGAAQSHFCSNLCDCCETGCVNQGIACDPAQGGQNCCFGNACNCTGAGLADGKSHCKPPNAATDCRDQPCTCGG